MDRAKHQNRIKKALWGIFGLFLYLLAGSTANAQVPWTVQYINYDIISAIGSSTISWYWPSNIIGNNNFDERVLKQLPPNNNYYQITNSIHCYPLAGGSSSFQNGQQRITINSATYNTTNNSFGAPDCDVSGYYYDVYRDTTASSTILYVIRYYYDAIENIYRSANVVGTTTTPTVPIAKNIEILKPTYGTTTPTTTVVVQISYKTPFSLDFRPTTTRYYEIVDALTGELNASYSVIKAANTAENVTITATNTVPIGSKYIRAMYLDESGNIYSEVDEVFFNVATNTYYQATGLLSPRDDTAGLTQIDCGLFEFGCQFQRALVFLFIPAQDKLDNFSNIWQTIAEKKPFGYVTVTINQLENLTATGTPDFDLGTIPFMDEIFSPFRTLLGGILWGVFALFFVRVRLSNLDI